MQKKCSTCTHSIIARHKPITGRPCDACVHLGRWEPLTNADAIRAMTDEELAEYLHGVQERGASIGKKAWLNWLLQPKEA